MSFRVVAIVALLPAVGCVATPTPIDLNGPPPSAAMENPNGKAEIVVVRDEFAFAAATFGIFINDFHVGELGDDKYVHHYVEPGMVKMFAGAEARSPARLPVEANRVYYFKAVPKMGWWFSRVQLEVIEDPAAGRALMEHCTDETFDEPRPFPFELDMPSSGQKSG